jgi:hypothetical protein
VDINEFVRLASAHAEAGHDSSQSVRRANRIADKLRSAMLEAFKSPGQTEQLMSLLDHPQAGPWIAFCALENLQLDPQSETHCLRVVRALASGTDPRGAGATLWLSDRDYDL